VRQVDEYTHLKEKLEKEVHELRKREQQLTLGEQQLHHQWSALEQHRDHIKKETKDAEKRLSETYEHQLELERLRIRELDDQKKHLQAQILEWEKRYDSKVAEFTSFKEQQNGRPEIQLQSDINMLTLEKVELERKVDSLTKSKLHYKQQWGRALRELSILKQKEQADARARLKKQQKELEHMRLRYLAHEEKEVMQSEKQELHDIKLELEKLKNERQPAQEDNKAVERKLHSEQSEGIDTDQQRALEETELDNKVARMIEERDTLMQTGVYSTNDRIITELDRQIRETLAMKGKRT
jgi:centrosomal protein CEP120